MSFANEAKDQGVKKDKGSFIVCWRPERQFFRGPQSYLGYADDRYQREAAGAGVVSVFVVSG